MQTITIGQAIRALVAAQRMPTTGQETAAFKLCVMRMAINLDLVLPADRDRGDATLTEEGKTVATAADVFWGID